MDDPRRAAGGADQQLVEASLSTAAAGYDPRYTAAANTDLRPRRRIGGALRLLVSATTSTGDEVVDLAVDCDDVATVGDVARHLARRLAVSRESTPEPRVVHSAGRHLGVVADPLADAPEPDQPPTLYVAGRPIDPATRVVDSDLRNGVLVGLDAPL